MTFDTAATRTASLILAVAASLAGCGGGGSSEASTVESTSSSQQAAAATQDAASASAGDQGAAVAVSGDVVTQTPPVAATSNTTTAGVAPAASDSSATVQLASADTTTSTTVAATTGGVLVTTKPSRSGVGVNLAGIMSYAAQVPTIDFMKKSSPWMTQCTDTVTCVNFTSPANGFDTLEEAKIDVDSDGWVKSLPAATDTTTKYRMVTTKITEGGVQQPGNYTVVYDGSGTMTYLGAGQKVAALSAPGRDVVAVTSSATPFYLRISATNPTNYIRNIRVYPPGGACQNTLDTYAASAAACTATTGKFVAFENFPAGSTWHPALLGTLKGFRSLRFMDWEMTNATLIANWTDRTPTTARTWTGGSGAPVEAMFDLAAKVGADPWMNIPPHATDAYVHSFAQLAHTHLAAGQTLNIEYGNEMWNTSFPATKWGIAQSQTVFPTQLASGANSMTVYLNWYALRLGQVCQIVKSEFGADASRVKCVANTQAANWGSTDNVLQCVYAQGALGQPCYKIFDAVAIAPYFGYYIGSGTTASAVSAWTSNADGGLGMMFQEINGTGINGLAAIAPLVTLGGKSSAGSVAEVNSWIVNTKAVVAKYGLPMLAYEGGQGLIPPNDTKVMNLMFAANRDARMGTAYQTLLTDWKNAGGGTFMYFSDVGVYSKSGMWGMRENMFDESNPKWKSAVSWRDQVTCWWTGC
jgi:hypothetical protein